MTLINKLRQENPPMSEISAEIENDYQVLSRELAQSHPLFALSPIVVTSNKERTSINKSQSSTFALKNNTRHFSWQETVFGYNISETEVKQSEINSLYLHDDSLTRTVMCSASKEYIALQYPPKYINVCVDNANKDDFVDMTVVPDQVIIPITVLDKGTPHKGYVSSKPQMITFSSRSHNSNGGPERAAIPAKRLLQRTTSIAVKSETSPPQVQNAKSTRHNRTEQP
ncbi:Uncharacterized protein APZ42_005005 [Daphnia magna]|uniref:Uncharacterized protein n=1 Tax=Daphnia magna TaxID=35525 RepID=A0A164GQ83_9CRUS|nr:Uncharacterized protein APZ42_005005 [Daphnia magna]